MLIKRDSRLVFRINNQRIDGGICARGSAGRIHDQGTPKSPPAETLIDGQTTDQASGQKRIARQPLGIVRRKIGQRKACRGEGIIRGNHAGIVGRDKAMADPPPHVLRRQFVKVAVKRRDAA